MTNPLYEDTFNDAWTYATLDASLIESTPRPDEFALDINLPIKPAIDAALEDKTVNPITLRQKINDLGAQEFLEQINSLADQIKELNILTNNAYAQISPTTIERAEKYLSRRGLI